MRTLLVAIALVATTLAFVPAAEAGQPCTTPPKRPPESIVWAVGCAAEGLPDPDELAPAVGQVEVDLRWMTACPGPWGHEERSQVGPVVVVTYECDDGGT